jgi:hypothetical protein
VTDQATEYQQASDDLLAALRRVWKVSERFHRRAPEGQAGFSLPQVLREVVEGVAISLGGTDLLVKHGSTRWEAYHVSALAAAVDSTWRPTRCLASRRSRPNRHCRFRSSVPTGNLG